MNNFHIGQQIVCLKDYFRPFPGYEFELPKGGRIYTIRGFQRIEDLCGFLLEEIVSPLVDWSIIGFPDLGITEPGWDYRGFRPVKTTSIEVFNQMLAPTPRVKEKA